MAIDRKYGRVITERGTIGEDEPVFIIRSRDRAAVDALKAYAQVAGRHGADDTLTDSVYESVMTIHRWQQDHPELVRTPTLDREQAEAMGLDET